MTPYHIQVEVQSVLEELKQLDIIECVPEDQPITWISPIVVVPRKNGGMRICVDMRLANDAIKLSFGCFLSSPNSDKTANASVLLPKITGESLLTV